MKTKFTKEKLLRLKPCTDGLAFAESLNFDFAKIYDQCEREDWLIWLLERSGNLDKPKTAELDVAFAEHVLPMFEEKYPNDKRPRQAIEAMKEWLKSPTEANRIGAAANAYAIAYATGAVNSKSKETRWQADKIRELIPNPFK